MHCKSIMHFFVLLFIIFQVTVGYSIRNERSTKSNSTTASVANSSDVDSLDDRFNLNFNVAQAQGFGPYGGHSLANSLSYGVNAGIRNANGHYQNLYSNSGSQSHGFSNGPGAPLTFANTGSRVRPGHAGGHAGAGVFGGRGTSFAQSQNQNIEIPLDNFGTVLLSNLKEPSNSTNSTSSTKSDSNEKDKAKANEPTSLVFT